MDIEGMAAGALGGLAEEGLEEEVDLLRQSMSDIFAAEECSPYAEDETSPTSPASASSEGGASLARMSAARLVLALGQPSKEVLALGLPEAGKLGLDVITRVLNDFTAGAIEIMNSTEEGVTVVLLPVGKPKGAIPMEIRFKLTDGGMTAHAKRISGETMAFHKVLRKLKEQLAIVTRMKAVEETVLKNPTPAQKRSRMTRALGKVRSAWRYMVGGSGGSGEDAKQAELAKLGIKLPPSPKK